MKTQRNFVIIKKLNNKQFIHTNLLLASPNCKKQLCESKASGREKRKICKAKRHEEEQMLFRVFCCGKEVTFNLDVFKKRNKKVDTYHIHKYNKHKQNQHIKSYSIFYAIRQENPNIKDLHEAAINSSDPVLAASCQKQKKRSEAYGAKRYYRKGSGKCTEWQVSHGIRLLCR